MKKFITVLVLTVLLGTLFTFTAAAATPAETEYDLSEYQPYDTEGATKIIIRLSDFGEEIHTWMFKENTVLTDVYIEDGITVIGSDCFSCCTSLKHVRLPETLKIISSGKSGAFDRAGLEEIYIPGSVENMGGESFRLCPLKKIVVGEGVDAFRSYSFEYCAPEEIVLPESIKTLDLEKMNTTNLVMHLPDNIERIYYINGKEIYVTEGSRTHEALIEYYKWMENSDKLGDNIILVPKSPQTGDSGIASAIIVLVAALGGMCLARKIRF